ncbi:uncharacterized protein CFAP90 isoform X2 [Nycticebus coucang]|uniref:uncharacterized protein CFAP90 isoform X2 n=1 Tax=Nycticebus coucang TaxID=9470 RepID=UPI00234D2F2F|nr:uncharacterized protein CFAP90 isoform X2 [Nycticebus coucang]
MNLKSCLGERPTSGDSTAQHHPEPWTNSSVYPGRGFQATVKHRRWPNAAAGQPAAAAGGLGWPLGLAKRTMAATGPPDSRGGEEKEAAEDEEEEITAATLRGKTRPPPISAQSAFSYIPPRRLDPKEHSYYYRQGKTGVISLYDCVFKRKLDYNQKLHRDDREHAKSLGLHVNEENWQRSRWAHTSITTTSWVVPRAVSLGAGEARGSADVFGLWEAHSSAH